MVVYLAGFDLLLISLYELNLVRAKIRNLGHQGGCQIL